MISGSQAKAAKSSSFKSHRDGFMMIDHLHCHIDIVCFKSHRDGFMIEARWLGKVALGGFKSHRDGFMISGCQASACCPLVSNPIGMAS